MNAPPAQPALDPRAWVMWGVAASLAPLLGRNPFPLLLVAVIAVTVRAVCLPRGGHGLSGGLLTRLMLVLVSFGVLLNVLTTRAGDRALFDLPGWLPLLSGTLTLNAAVYGLLAGLALLTLALVATTVGAALDLSPVLRLIPERLLGVAVASSIAVNLVPQTIVAFTEIREAQLARGLPLRSRRQLVPLVVPVLSSGIERAMGLAEVLEARGFGATTADRRGGLDRWLGALLLGCAVVAAYSSAAGRPSFALPAFIGGVGALALLVWHGRQRPVRRTRFRPLGLTERDWLVIGASSATAAALLVVRSVRPSALLYEPYPSLTPPAVSLPALLPLFLLFAPALVQPRRQDDP